MSEAEPPKAIMTGISDRWKELIVIAGIVSVSFGAGSWYTARWQFPRMLELEQEKRRLEHENIGNRIDQLKAEINALSADNESHDERLERNCQLLANLQEDRADALRVCLLGH